MARTQENIKNWFDEVYLKRGDLYLRPVEAYLPFLDIIPHSKNSKIIDIACGLGRLLQVFKEEVAELYGIDISEVAVKEAKKRVPSAKIKTGNAESLPYPDAFFDVVCCIGSLERFIRLEKALSEQKRIGKPNAQYCFMVRNSKTLSWRLKSFLKLQNIKGHQGARTLEEWIKVFQNSGFRIENIYPDPWPRNRVLWWLSLRGFLPLNYTALRKPLLPLKYANEYIFILSKDRE